MLTPEMIRLIQTYTAGAVATINHDGTPSVSTKATFVVVDPRTIAFGNLRSPGTIANLRERPAVEVCFLDVLKRKAVRVTGTGRLVPVTDADVRPAFDRHWADYIERMRGFVRIDVRAAELILSPAYDVGATEAELLATNLAKLNAIE
ncbi:MAG: pyridoxamine 5'-phosphate oxidase family protein [Alphaproteobacteria bacterium]|nr:pyridoxamine 5'-phosphate oxidase family protein [Alphaproteobacteria bacterium]